MADDPREKKPDQDEDHRQRRGQRDRQESDQKGLWNQKGAEPKLETPHQPGSVSKESDHQDGVDRKARGTKDSPALTWDGRGVAYRDEARPDTGADSAPSSDRDNAKQGSGKTEEDRRGRTSSLNDASIARVKKDASGIAGQKPEDLGAVKGLAAEWNARGVHEFDKAKNDQRRESDSAGKGPLLRIDFDPNDLLDDDKYRAHLQAVERLGDDVGVGSADKPGNDDAIRIDKAKLLRPTTQFSVNDILAGPGTVEVDADKLKRATEDMLRQLGDDKPVPVEIDPLKIISDELARTAQAELKSGNAAKSWALAGEAVRVDKTRTPAATDDTSANAPAKKAGDLPKPASPGSAHEITERAQKLFRGENVLELTVRGANIFATHLDGRLLGAYRARNNGTNLPEPGSYLVDNKRGCFVSLKDQATYPQGRFGEPAKGTLARGEYNVFSGHAGSVLALGKLWQSADRIIVNVPKDNWSIVAMTGFQKIAQALESSASNLKGAAAEYLKSLATPEGIGTMLATMAAGSAGHMYASLMSEKELAEGINIAKNARTRAEIEIAGKILARAVIGELSSVLLAKAHGKLEKAIHSFRNPKGKTIDPDLVPSYDPLKPASSSTPGGRDSPRGPIRPASQEPAARSDPDATLPVETPRTTLPPADGRGGRGRVDPLGRTEPVSARPRAAAESPPVTINDVIGRLGTSATERTHHRQLLSNLGMRDNDVVSWFGRVNHIAEAAGYRPSQVDSHLRATCRLLREIDHEYPGNWQATAAFAAEGRSLRNIWADYRTTSEYMRLRGQLSHAQADRLTQQPGGITGALFPRARQAANQHVQQQIDRLGRQGFVYDPILAGERNRRGR